MGGGLLDGVAHVVREGRAGGAERGEVLAVAVANVVEGQGLSGEGVI